jgi:hypothetical protein
VGFLKVLYLDQNVVIVEKDGRKTVIYPYCGCNSGLWFLISEEISKETFKQLPLSLQEKLKKLGFAP